MSNLAERLNALAPGSADKRSFFVNSGAEAIENAVKIARSFTGRQAVVAFDHAFHGRTLLTMSLTAKAMPYKSGFGPFAPEVYRMPFSYPYRCTAGASPERCGEACADLAIASMDKQIGANRIACLLVEPVQGEGGVINPGEGFIPRLGGLLQGTRHRLHRRRGAGRHGEDGQAVLDASTSGVVPDLVTTAKGLGRRPSDRRGDRAGRHHGRHPSRWTRHRPSAAIPCRCAAALGALSEIESGGLVQRSQEIGEIFKARLGNLAKEVPVIGDVRIIGAMAALEFVTDPKTKQPDVVTTSKVLSDCHAEGVIVLKAGTYDNVVRIVPPLVMSDDLFNDGLSVLEKAVRSL